MIQKYSELSKDFFFSKIKTLLRKDEDKISLSILGWEDGDYFKELTDEDGGVTEEQLLFFENIPLGKKISLQNLKNLVNFCKFNPYLHSKNKNYKFHFDLHIWTKKYYLVYNFYLEKVFVKKLTLFNKIFQTGIQPKWQNEHN